MHATFSTSRLSSARQAALRAAQWVVFCLTAVFASALPAADPTAQQIERAQVLREMDEAQVKRDAEPRLSLPPASLDAKQNEAAQKAQDAAHRDARWRTLLENQSREANLPDPQPGSAPVRSLLDSRGEQAYELQRKIQNQDLQYRLQQHP